MVDTRVIKRGLVTLTESGLIPYRVRVYYLKQALAGEDVDVAMRSAIQLSQHTKCYDEWRDAFSDRYYDDQYEERRIQCVTILDDTYPDRLREIDQPPLVLFVQGDPSLLQLPSLSVVGARKGTAYAKTILERLLPPLAGHLAIVSGLARGVDRWSHETAIKYHLKTIGVIGTGLAHIYPKENQALQTYMATHECVVSALPLHAGVRRWQFPFRNEIIAGLSLGTLVIEAAKESGSLITANYALQYNREVMAVPGRLTDLQSGGCNALIQAGALPVLNARDILDDLMYLLEGRVVDH